MPDHINDRPDKAFARLLRDHFLSFKEIIFESGKQRDSIAVWLVGMSTGAIAITISQIGKLNHALYPVIKWSVGFLTGTIILGLLFRVFHLFLQDRDRFNMSYVVSWLAGWGEPSQEPPVNLPEEADAGVIAGLLYNHMGIDIDPNWLASIAIENDVESWRKQYEGYTESYYLSAETREETLRDAFNRFCEVMTNLEGVPLLTHQQIEKMDNSMGVRKRRLRKACTFFYTSMCISFAISVLIISYGFIKTDLKELQSTVITNQKVISPANQVQNTQTDKPE